MKKRISAALALLMALAGGCAGYVQYQHEGWTVGVGLKFEPKTAENINTETAGLDLAETE
jgi:hypothetical protein